MGVNARFWTWHNGGWVKLTMRPGQTLRPMPTGGPTQEGWTCEEGEWEFDGMAVYSRWSSDGVDCDGRLSTFGESVCMVDMLRAVDMMEMDPCPENVGIRTGAWERVKRSQRDYAAEAMGY